MSDAETALLVAITADPAGWLWTAGEADLYAAVGLIPALAAKRDAWKELAATWEKVASYKTWISASIPSAETVKELLDSIRSLKERLGET